MGITGKKKKKKKQQLWSVTTWLELYLVCINWTNAPPLLVYFKLVRQKIAFFINIVLKEKASQMNSSFHPSLFCCPLPDPLYPRINQPSVTSSSFSPLQPPIHTLYLLFYMFTQAYTHKASYPLSDLDSLALQDLFFAYSVFQSHLLSPSFTVRLYSIVRPCIFLLFSLLS